MRYLSETVVVERFNGTVTDERGNEVEDWAAGVEIGVYAFDPGGSAETIIDGHVHRVVSSPRVFFEPGTVLGSRDRVTARGVLYEVNGEPLVFSNPYDASMDNVTVTLRVVTG